MNEPTTNEKVNWTDQMRTLKPGDPPLIADYEYHKSIESIRVRETKASGAEYSIKRNKKAGTVSVYCILKPIFYSPHGLTIKAKYIGRCALPTDADELHEIKVYTGYETLFVHKTSGEFRRQYDSFQEFLLNWELL